MEEVKDIKYFGRRGSMEREVRERAVKGRQIIGALESSERKREVGAKEWYKKQTSSKLYHKHQI